MTVFSSGGPGVPGSQSASALSPHDALLPADTKLRRKLFFQRVASNSCILFDGSISTLLYQRGVFINRSFDEVNLDGADLVAEIHREYAAAGAHVITTNTWGANACKLAAYGLEDKVVEINRAGARIAREVAGTQCWIAGSIGPLGVRIEPWGPTSFDEAKAFFAVQARAMLEGGADILVLEGFADLGEIQQALRAAKELEEEFGPLPIVAQMATNDDGQSLFGTEPEWFARKLDEWGATIVGVNGGNGPTPALEVLKRLKEVTSKPIVLQPNAGLPRQVDGRLIYMASPEYMGEFARQAILLGVRALGGCSGTTPAHTRSMAGAVRQGYALASGSASRSLQISDETRAARVPPEEKSNWARKIAKGEFVICMELLPPKGLDTEKLIARSIACREAGIDAINIPDGPRASARMSALAAACILERDARIETILHYACRDRNLLGIQSDLIGAAGLGLRNVLCITGDPPKMGPYPNATAVFDIDAIGLVNMASRLNDGQDLGGSSTGIPTRFSIGIGANPVAPDLEREKSRYAWKVEAGAEWAVTQPVFEPDSLFRFLDFAGRYGVPIIAGIWPLTSLRNAEFMANEVPGVYVPPHILERMRRCRSAEEQRAEGLAIARELVASIKNSVAGLQISAPMGNVEFALELLK